MNTSSNDDVIVNTSRFQLARGHDSLQWAGANVDRGMIVCAAFGNAIRHSEGPESFRRGVSFQLIDPRTQTRTYGGDLEPFLVSAGGGSCGDCAVDIHTLHKSIHFSEHLFGTELDQVRFRTHISGKQPLPALWYGAPPFFKPEGVELDPESFQEAAHEVNMSQSEFDGIPPLYLPMNWHKKLWTVCVAIAVDEGVVTEVTSLDKWVHALGFCAKVGGYITVFGLIFSLCFWKRKPQGRVTKEYDGLTVPWNVEREADSKNESSDEESH
mmetsp:Transcript_31892/g.71820  ORF Transcript_31892/g.71820 Transcript_31892/m.71820 type:complete len:269 (-) Transcript_31892:3-809(-)